MNARRAALLILSDVLDREAYCNLSLKNVLPSVQERDRAFTAALVYGVLDHLYYVDWLLKPRIQKKPDPQVMHILRMGITELLYLNTPAHAAISENVTLCRQCGKSSAAGFINAVLRGVDRDRETPPPLPADPACRLSVQFSFPLWLVQEWIKEYGEAFTQALLSSPAAPVQLRAQWPCTAQKLLCADLPEGTQRGRWDPECLIPPPGWNAAAAPAFTQGRMTIQSQGAMLICRALGDMRKKRVLDACAAPGGKTAYLWSLCQGDVLLTAWELHEHRRALMDATLDRLHVRAETAVRDAAIPDASLRERFDAVLIDAPCSGLGMLMRKPDIRYRKTGGDVDALAALQKSILNACGEYVCPGGVLLYATCTISRRENQEQTADFLKEHPEFTLEPMELPIPNDGMLQLFPNVHGTDGFFMARMRKCS